MDIIQTILKNNPVIGKYGEQASLLNTARHPQKTSEKYRETNDVAVVKAFNDAGWHINSYKQVKARNSVDQIYKPFLATFINDSFPSIPGVGSLTVLFSNAKDGTKPSVFNLGFYVFLCSNGLKVGRDIFPETVVRHKGSPQEQVAEILGTMLEQSKKVYSVVNQMQNKLLTEQEALTFADEAANLRFSKHQLVDPGLLLETRREEEKGLSLWTVFNKVQENIIRPSKDLKYKNLNPGPEDAKKKRRTDMRKARPVNNIALDMQINEGLWSLAANYL